MFVLFSLRSLILSLAVVLMLLSFQTAACDCLKWQVTESRRGGVIEREVRERLLKCVDGVQDAVKDFDELDLDLLIMRLKRMPLAELAKRGPDSRNDTDRYSDFLTPEQLEQLKKLIVHYYRE